MLPLRQVECPFALFRVVEQCFRLVVRPRQRSLQSVGQFPLARGNDEMVQVDIGPLCLLAAFVAPVLVGVVFKIIDQLLQRFIFVEGIVDTRVQVLMTVVIDPYTVQGSRPGRPAGGVYRFDACELRPSAPVGSGAVLYIPSRVGGREFVLVVEIIFESTPQVVGDTFVFRPVLLQDIVPLSADGRFRMHIFRRAAVSVTRRVGEIRRIFLSRVRQVHPSRRREIIPLFSCQRHFSFQGILQALVVLDD